MVEGTLAWFRAELEARKAAFAKMLEAPGLAVEQREMWAERLADVELVIADVGADPLGYLVWLVAERHVTSRKQTDRFSQ